ncbi:PspA/IM30 family protein [Sporosarcina highlanderae]|uniref:PspA/IM30 family protein n=1 Tax=Sporosarcina highlanderae TaxID=3035916 RepID=A0ABT8JM25_9BACL|nr:PspA/IM30 family protein [Sporosarcina highlanderae]MDN4606206.1 PspA/IM30 family protein [Sporosarcina highlanderae]
MNTLWNRIKYTVQADLHTVLDKKESKNPIAMLNQYVKEAEKQTGAVGKLLERQGKLKLALEKEYAEAKAMLEKRRNQLSLAESTGEEDLIAFAQDEIRAYETRAADLATSIAEASKELFNLERKFEEMKHKVKDMKVRQLQLMGKENVTRAHRRMDKFISPENGDKQVSSVEEMNSYIESLGGEINREYESSSMERRLELLEKNAAKNVEIV